MELDHSFSVPAPAQDLWPIVQDVPRIAACLPGATIDPSSGSPYSGGIKVKVGPIAMTYRGTIDVTDVDDENHRIVMSASGRETGGAGTAKATIEARLVPEGDQATRVLVHTDFEVTGKPAQFGRGMLADVGRKLLDRFADQLAATLTGPQDPAAGTSKDPAREPAAAGLDLVSVVAGPVLKRVLPVVAAIVLTVLVIRRRRSR